MGTCGLRFVVGKISFLFGAAFCHLLVARLCRTRIEAMLTLLGFRRGGAIRKLIDLLFLHGTSRRVLARSCSRGQTMHLRASWRRRLFSILFRDGNVGLDMG